MAAEMGVSQLTANNTALMEASQLTANDGLPLDGPGGDPSSVVQVVNTVIYPGQTNVVSVELLSQGDEAALGFSLAFDPGALGFCAASVGSGAPGATLMVNTNQLSSGLLGLALSLPIGRYFSPQGRSRWSASALLSRQQSPEAQPSPSWISPSSGRYRTCTPTS